MLDKTPAWISWTLRQALELDMDMMKKLGLVSKPDQKPAPAARTISEENDALRKMGFTPRRA